MSSTILITGSYNTGKKSIVSAFAGKEVSALTVEADYHFQVKGTKGNVTLQCLPEEYGRMPVYRERVKAVTESQAFIFTANETSRAPTWYHNMVKEQMKTKMGPSILLFTYKTDKAPAVPQEVAKFAKDNNLKIEMLNISNLSSDTVKLEKIIANLEFDVKNAVTPVSDEKVTKEETTKKTAPSRNRLVRFFSSIINPTTAAA